MFFGSHDDEDIDFHVTGGSGSKLANLFTSDQVRGEDSKQSLTYTAPKQPTKKPEAQGSPSVSVLHAVAVHTFKLENQQYVAQGKLGAAILGNHETSTYQLLLYKGQQQHVTMASVTPAFSYNVQPNFYANFYDNKRECWSIRFDTEQASVEFARQLALSKANSADAAGSHGLIIQDLILGQDDPLENGHMVEVRYSGWLLTNSAQGQMFDSNVNSQTALRLKLGKGKVIKGWEEGLIGAKKGGRRLLVVPPSLAYGTQGFGDKIPPNSTLIFDLQVVKTKHPRESRSATPVTPLTTHGGEEISSTISSHQPISQVQQDDSVKARGASISEQLSQSPKTEKALLISRMAKMGMPMLPMQQAQPSSESENEDDAISKGRSSGSPLRVASPKPTIKPRPSPVVPGSHLEQMAHPVAAVPLTPNQQHHQVALLHQQQYGMLGQPYPYPYPQSAGAMFAPPAYPASSAAPSVGAEATHWPLLLAESRTQNSEMRITLGKISDRVDTVLSKLGEVRNSQLPETTQYMESNVLLQNIQRIVQENNKLRSDTEDKNTKILGLNDKICDLLQRNQKLVEDSNQLLEKRSDTFQSSSTQSQTRLMTLEQEKSGLSSELSDALSRVTELQLKLQRQQSHHITKGDEQLNIQLEEQDNIIAGLQQNLRSLRGEKKELSSKIETLQDQLQDLQSSKNSLEKTMERTQRKLSEERRRAQEEIEEVKGSCQEPVFDEVETLRQKMMKQKTPSSEQEDVGKLEMKFQADKNALQKEISLLKTSLQDAINTKEDLEQQAKDLKTKLDEEKHNRIRASELKSEIATLAVWKTKYEELLRSSEFMRLKKEDGMKGSEATAAQVQEMVEAKLKKAMNALYRGLQRDFQPSESFTGSQSLKLVLNMIKLVTTAVLEDSKETPEAATLESTPTSSHVPTPAVNVPTPAENIPAEKVAEQLPSVPENTPKLSEKLESQDSSSNKDVSVQEKPVESVKSGPPEDQQDSVGADKPSQENGVPITRETSDKLKNTPKLGSSPKSEDSDDFNRARLTSLSSPDDANKKYVFFDKKSKSWKPQPPPPPLFDDEDDEEDEDDWLK